MSCNLSSSMIIKGFISGNLCIFYLLIIAKHGTNEGHACHSRLIIFFSHNALCFCNERDVFRSLQKLLDVICINICVYVCKYRLHYYYLCIFNYSLLMHDMICLIENAKGYLSFVHILLIPTVLNVCFIKTHSKRLPQLHWGNSTVVTVANVSEVHE